MTTQASLDDGRVVVVTGGGRGIGRAEALAFARQGAHVVVSDVLDPDGHTSADNVVRKSRPSAAGPSRVPPTSLPIGGEELIALALSAFGGLDTLVNNADILRDRMFVNMSFQEWHAVIAVHLTGTFTTSRYAGPQPKNWRYPDQSLVLRYGTRLATPPVPSLQCRPRVDGHCDPSQISRVVRD
jgi:NAD(P)-dependent dehydrogenase (short-subunit alcohol dehydrogenase family)